MLPNPRAVRINCRRLHLPLTIGAHRTEMAGALACAIITARQPKSHGGPSHPPPASPTTRAVASPEKVRPQRTTTTTTVGI
jgi:hypothetical protein